MVSKEMQLRLEGVTHSKIWMSTPVIIKLQLKYLVGILIIVYRAGNESIYVRIYVQFTILKKYSVRMGTFTA